MELQPVLYALILKQRAEELHQVEQEERRHGNNDANQEALAGLQEIQGLAHAADAGGVLAHHLGLVDGKGVGDAVVFALGLEDQVVTAVINIVDGMGVEDPLAVDNGPVGDDVPHPELGGVLNGLVDNKVAGLQDGVHGVRLHGEHFHAQDIGHAVA